MDNEQILKRIENLEKYVKNLEKENLLLKEEIKLYKAKLEFDRLTSVYNKKAFENLVSNYNDSGVLVIIDIDDFKSINDTYGHLKGDEILIKLGDVLNSEVRKNDLVGRFGGDEFLIFFKNINLLDADKILSRLIKDINKIKIADNYYLSISYGLTLYNNNITYNDNLKLADQALYESKKADKIKKR